MRLRALNSPREGPASPAHPLVCRMSSELCLLADRSPESGGALEAAVGWWYWVGRGGGTALCFGQIHAHSAQHCWSLRGWRWMSLQSLSTCGRQRIEGACLPPRSAWADDLPAYPLIPLAASLSWVVLPLHPRL